MDFFGPNDVFGRVDGDANEIIFISFYFLTREWHMLLNVRKEKKLIPNFSQELSFYLQLVSVCHRSLQETQSPSPCPNVTSQTKKKVVSELYRNTCATYAWLGPYNVPKLV